MVKRDNFFLRLVSFLIAIFFTFFSFFPSPAVAREKFVTVINPLRGNDFWQTKDQSPLDFVSFQKKLFKKVGVDATWLLRPDVLFDSDLSSFFTDDEFKNDELGVFLEVTPLWAKKAGVAYIGGRGWSLAEDVFLSGYNPKDRKKLLGSAFERFKEIFGYYPKTIGAWHVDPYTANLAREKYKIEAILICADQFSTDGYQIWGGWWGVPFYPSKKNLLVPAASKKDKLDVVILWWAARDPLNGYGPSVAESTFSVQVNDYATYHKLDASYFSSLADLYLNPREGEFGQLTIGLENGYELKTYGNGFRKQVIILSQKGTAFVKASEFASWYKSRFPNLSPPHQIGGKDLLGSQKEAEWIMDINKRVGLVKKSNDKWVVRDLRLYQPAWPDPYLRTKNLAGKLYWNIPAKIDSVREIGEVKEWSGKVVFANDNLHLYRDNWWWTLPVLFIFLVCMKLFRPPFKALLLIVLGGLIFSLTMVRSGRLYDFGMGFWGPNGHDGIWHLSLMNQTIKKIPPKNPVFAKESLKNYHWGFDLLAGWLAKLLPFSSLTVYFRLLPVTFAFLIGFLSFYLAKSVTGKFWVGFWFAFLNFFAGSFGWIVTLLRERKIGGESLFWSMQSISTLLNPPYAFSLVVLFVGMIIWVKKRRIGRWYEGVILGILFGILVGIKVYAGILSGLSLFSFWYFQKKKKRANLFDLWSWIIAALVSTIILFSIGVFSGRPSLVFKPLWFVHSLVESFDKLYLPKIAVLRINLVANWLSWKLPFLLLLEVFLIGVFVLGNLGTRILGWFELARRVTRRQLRDFDLLVIPLLVYSFIFPLLFVQRGTTWNTIQFFYYFLLFSNFYFAFFLARLTESESRKRRFLLLLTLLLSLPTTISTLKGYLGFPSPATIPYYELEGLEFLKNQREGIVLTFPYDEFKKSGITAPLPLYLYESTAYVSALTEKISFLEDEMNLQITGYPWRERKEKVKRFFNTQDKIWSRGFLLNNSIDYLYLVNDQKLPLQPADLGIKMIFDNGQVRIYQVLK